MLLMLMLPPPMQDTAEIYPVAPRRETANRTSTYIGRWLATQPRDRWVVASKVTGALPSTHDIPPPTQLSNRDSLSIYMLVWSGALSSMLLFQVVLLLLLIDREGQASTCYTYAK